MRSLKTLCEDPGFPLPQREYFNMEVEVLLSVDGSKKDIAISCLRKVWTRYDLGGISMGRSLRSGLLEKVQTWLDNDHMDKAKLGLSILIAMYYDLVYINKCGWGGIEKLEEMWELPLWFRIQLSAAGLALELDEIPEMSDWDRDKIFALITEQ